MQTVVLLLLFAAVTYALNSEDVGVWRKRVMKYGGECQIEQHANADDISHIMQKMIPPRKEGRCLLFCIHKKIGFQDESGKKNIPGINSWTDEMIKLDESFGKKMKQIADACVSTVDDSGEACDTAGITFDCYMKLSDQLGVTMMLG